MNPYQEDKGKVYFFSDGEYIKIGFTTETIDRRLKRLSTGTPHKLYSLGYFSGEMADETKVHKKFCETRLRVDGEWFQPTQELIDYINEVSEQNTYVELDNGRVMAYKAIKQKDSSNS